MSQTEYLERLEKSLVEFRDYIRLHGLTCDNAIRFFIRKNRAVSVSQFYWECDHLFAKDTIRQAFKRLVRTGEIKHVEWGCYIRIGD